MAKRKEKKRYTRAIGKDPETGGIYDYLTLRREMRPVTIRAGKIEVGRKFEPWFVCLFIRRGIHDMMPESAMVCLYSLSGQPAQAATVAAKLWRKVARDDKGVGEFEPWPEVDSHCVVERLDDSDYEEILKDAGKEGRADELETFGHPKYPWAFITFDQEMTASLLSRLKQEGPTIGGIPDDHLPPELGGRGFEVPAEPSPGQPEI